MAEWAGSWNALIASLSVADLDDPDRTWRFLRGCGLVLETPDGPAALREAIAVEKARGRITGATFGSRVAEHLVALGLAQSEASSPYAFAKLAAQKWATFQQDDAAGQT